jgi:hypothetical protein
LSDAVFFNTIAPSLNGRGGTGEDCQKTAKPTKRQNGSGLKLEVKLLIKKYIGA